MLLAELEVRHSRAVAPTRRVALGTYTLPTDPAPGHGGVLLGAIVAAHIDAIDPLLRKEFLTLTEELEYGKRISQPRMRHRFQTDVVGLERTRHALIRNGEDMYLELGANGRSVPQLLGAAYAVRLLHQEVRPAVFTAIRKGAQWVGDIGSELLAHLADPTSTPTEAWRQFPTDERWALQVLGFEPDLRPEPDEVQRRFRSLIRAAHPDHGAESVGAGLRILELTEARRILISSD